MQHGKLRIILFDAKPYDQEFFNRINQDPRYGYEIRYITGRLTEDTVALTAGFDCVCVFVNDDINASIINKLYENGIRILALRSAGYNNVDLDAAYRKIHVVRVPAYSPYAIAEHTVALMLSLNRKIHKAYIRTRENNFTINGLLGFDMHGKTAGVIGTGKIGKMVIQILKGFGMKILAFDVYPDFKFAEQTGIEYASLDTIYQESDIITLHCPLTPENVHMINADTISRMKKGVMIINTGRGKLINTRDLIAALKERKIGSGDLMYTRRKEIISLRTFLQNRSVMIFWPGYYPFQMCWLPRIRHFTREAIEKITETTLENIRLYFEQNQLPNEICYRCSEVNAPESLPVTVSDLFYFHPNRRFHRFYWQSPLLETPPY